MRGTGDRQEIRAVKPKKRFQSLGKGLVISGRPEHLSVKTPVYDIDSLGAMPSRSTMSRLVYSETAMIRLHRRASGRSVSGQADVIDRSFRLDQENQVVNRGNAALGTAQGQVEIGGMIEISLAQPFDDSGSLHQAFRHPRKTITVPESQEPYYEDLSQAVSGQTERTLDRSRFARGSQSDCTVVRRIPQGMDDSKGVASIEIRFRTNRSDSSHCPWLPGDRRRPLIDYQVVYPFQFVNVLR